MVMAHAVQGQFPGFTHAQTFRQGLLLKLLRIHIKFRHKNGIATHIILLDVSCVIHIPLAILILEEIGVYVHFGAIGNGSVLPLLVRASKFLAFRHTHLALGRICHQITVFEFDDLRCPEITLTVSVLPFVEDIGISLGICPMAQVT